MSPLIFCEEDYSTTQINEGVLENVGEHLV